MLDGIDARKILRVMSVGVIIASIVAFGWVASGAIRTVDSLAPVRWFPLVGAIALQFVMLFVLMLVWERLLGILWIPEGRAQKPSTPNLYAAYSRSWLARYIPGRICSLGGRALLTNRLGVPVDVVVRSMVIEVIFTYVLLTIISGALLLGTNFHLLGGGGLLVVGLVVFTAGALQSQKILSTSLSGTDPNSAWWQTLRRACRLITGGPGLTLPNIASGIVVYSIYSCMQLGFIVLVAGAFAQLSISQAAIIAGAWGVSLTLGWISFLAPVGLGVRDGLAFTLFAQVLDPATAGIIVTASRVVMLIVDLAFIGVVEGAVKLLTLCLSWSRRKQRAVPSGSAALVGLRPAKPNGQQPF
jgi:hypothetical protein